MRRIPTSLLCAALAGVAFLAVGCCKGAAQQPSARKSFIDSFNDQQMMGCKLTSASPDHKKITYTCKSQELSLLETQISTSCGGFQLVGFETMTLTGKDGTETCDMSTDCSCKP